MDAERIELMPAPVVSADWRIMLWIGAAVIFFTFGGLGGWSAVARIDSAVVADGTVAIESNRKTIQHLEGGIVREILVRDGDVVHQGDTLLRLDPTRNAAADLGYRQQLAIATVLQARLMAQRDMRDRISLPSEVTAAEGDPLILNAIRDNQSQFDNRRESLVRGIEVIDKQIAQARAAQGQWIESARAEHTREARPRATSVPAAMPEPCTAGWAGPCNAARLLRSRVSCSSGRAGVEKGSPSSMQICISDDVLGVAERTGALTVARPGVVVLERCPFDAGSPGQPGRRRSISSWGRSIPSRSCRG